MNKVMNQRGWTKCSMKVMTDFNGVPTPGHLRGSIGLVEFACQDPEVDLGVQRPSGWNLTNANATTTYILCTSKLQKQAPLEDAYEDWMPQRAVWAAIVAWILAAVYSDSHHGIGMTEISKFGTLLHEELLTELKRTPEYMATLWHVKMVDSSLFDIFARLG